MPKATARSIVGSAVSIVAPPHGWRSPCTGWRRGIYPMQRASAAGVLEYRIDFGPGYRI